MNPQNPAGHRLYLLPAADRLATIPFDTFIVKKDYFKPNTIVHHGEMVNILSAVFWLSQLKAINLRPAEHIRCSMQSSFELMFNLVLVTACQ